MHEDAARTACLLQCVGVLGVWMGLSNRGGVGVSLEVGRSEGQGQATGSWGLRIQCSFKEWLG